FAPQREAFANLMVPKWIPPQSNESLAGYAARLARQVDIAGKLGPCFIGGASFGGFVALEMARHLDAKACFLIGSVRSPDQLPLRIRALRACRGAATRMLFEWVCRIAGVGE